MTKPLLRYSSHFIGRKVRHRRETRTARLRRTHRRIAIWSEKNCLRKQFSVCLPFRERERGLQTTLFVWCHHQLFVVPQTLGSFLWTLDTRRHFMQCYGTTTHIMQCYGTTTHFMQCYGTTTHIMQCYGTTTHFMQCYGTTTHIMQCYGTTTHFMQCYGTTTHFMTTTLHTVYRVCRYTVQYLPLHCVPYFNAEKKLFPSFCS